LLRRFAPLNDDKTQMLSSANSRHTRASGVSSTPRLLGSITDVSGILDRPVKPGDDDWECCGANVRPMTGPATKQSILPLRGEMDCFARNDG
jgi:hypothetical protein